MRAEHGEEGPSEDGVGEEASRDAFEEIDFGREFQDYLDPGYKTQEIEYKEDAPTFEQFLTRPPSLADHLEWQLHMSQIEEKVCDAAIAVIGNLNADGRLNATTEEIARMGEWSEEIVEQARQVAYEIGSCWLRCPRRQRVFVGSTRSARGARPAGDEVDQ